MHFSFWKTVKMYYSLFCKFRTFKIRAYRFRILMMFVNKICVYSIEPFYTKDYISCIFTFKGYVLILFQYFLKSIQYFTRGHKEKAIGGLSTVEWFLQKVWIGKINLHKRNKNIHLKKVGLCWHFILFVHSLKSVYVCFTKIKEFLF